KRNVLKVKRVEKIGVGLQLDRLPQRKTLTDPQVHVLEIAIAKCVPQHEHAGALEGTVSEIPAQQLRRVVARAGVERQRASIAESRSHLDPRDAVPDRGRSRLMAGVQGGPVVFARKIERILIRKPHELTLIVVV